MKDITQLEKTILDKELHDIENKLGQIGVDLFNIFEKYGKIKGRFKSTLIKYLTTNVISGTENYYSGHSTKPYINKNTDNIPDQLKEAILKWAVNDFMERVDSVTEIVAGMDFP